MAYIFNEIRYVSQGLGAVIKICSHDDETKDNQKTRDSDLILLL